MADKLTSVKGMNDILPSASVNWQWFEHHVRETMTCASFKQIRTPILEYTPLFVKGTGQSTDIVEKEMYSFVDRLNGEELTLRPENTPGVVRAAIEHNLVYDGGKRLYYTGPMFRHERPQRGRFRQFHQLGVEAIGFAGPEVDAEVMLLAHQLFSRLGLSGYQLELNSLGLPSERMAHRQALVAYFEQHSEILDEDARRRLVTNPLRILDTKNPALQAMVQAAPQLLSFLGEDSLKRLETVRRLCAACGLATELNPRLVRGLDYYAHTVFEFVSSDIGAQATLCGGGRYDGLFELLGGKPTPGVGWGMGIERVLDLALSQAVLPVPTGPDAYAVIADAASLEAATATLFQLRQAGVCVQMHASADGGIGSMKTQFKKADASGARYALVFTEQGLTTGHVAIKPLREAASDGSWLGESAQRVVSLSDWLNWAPTLRL